MLLLQLESFYLMMSLPVMSLGGRFCVDKKGGTGRGGWAHLGLKPAWYWAVERPWLALSTSGPFVCSFT